MHQISKLIRELSSPAVLIIVVWCAIFAMMVIGPIDFLGHPTSATCFLVASGVLLFVLAERLGRYSFNVWGAPRVEAPVSSSALNIVVIATSLIGLTGIGLLAFDRQVLSGVGNGGYAELLRCAPSLADFVDIKRTPLLYLGYLNFSFSFASLVLFFLKGEEIHGWAATLAQLSIISPVGYALLYSGRMPILFLIILVVAAMMVRVGQGRRLLPSGHRLVVKLVLIVLVFSVYSSAIWSRRLNFCIQVSELIDELSLRQAARNQKQAQASPPQQAVDGITAGDLRKRIDEALASSPKVVSESESASQFLSKTMQEAWGVKPRPYVFFTVDSGYVSSKLAMSLLSSYYYLTHGVRTIDTVWQARSKFSPQLGLYEIGILSPIVRVLLPQYSALITDMQAQLESAGIYGFFPTFWVAAFIDFGFSGAILYIIVFGFLAGWCASGAGRSSLVAPQLLLCFILASIFLSPVQGPLGVGNSFLVLVSLLITGLAVDFSKDKSPTTALRTA